MTEDLREFVERHTFRATLDDGTPIRIRPLLPEDREKLAEGMKQLSPTSRYLRFLQPKASLTDHELTYLTEIDYVDHFAWAATLDEPDGPGIGVARYIRDAQDPSVAEAAVAVIDHYQGLGLGTILVQALAETAASNGIERFRARVAGVNQQVVDSLRLLGARLAEADQDALILEMPLPLEQITDSALYRVLRAAATGHANVRGPAH